VTDRTRETVLFALRRNRAELRELFMKQVKADASKFNTDQTVLELRETEEAIREVSEMPGVGSVEWIPAD